MENLWEATADFYDEHHDGDVGDEEFYLGKAQEADGKVLEIACGTGRIYLELLENNVDAYGIDLSEEMLAELRKKAKDRKLEPEVRKADMRDFDLEEKFELIIIPFRSFLHNTSIDDAASTLEKCYDHLEDGGKLVLNFFVPDFKQIGTEYGSWTEQELEKDGEEYLERNKTELVDPINMVARMTTQVMKDGELVREGSTKMKIFTKNEMELLLENSSFSDWEIFGGFDEDELDEESEEMVWEIEK